MRSVGLKRCVRAGLRLLGLALLAAALGGAVFVLAMALALPDEPLLPFWAAALAILALLVLAGGSSGGWRRPRGCWQIAPGDARW